MKNDRGLLSTDNASRRKDVLVSILYTVPKSSMAIPACSPAKKVDFAESAICSAKNTESDTDKLHALFSPSSMTGNAKFKKLTAATMLRVDGIPRDALDKKRLKPDDCYLIWSVTLVGKFGAFYEASEGAKLKPVTIKVYRPKIFGRNYESGIEKKILSHTPKPDCIPRLIRTFKYDFQNVLILERLEMYPLQYRLWNYLRLNPKDALIYFTEMVFAVSFLHARNVIHRNLYLGSFWIQPSGHLKLIDYSRCVEGNSKYRLFGKRVSNYTAPELLTRGRYTKMVDIWALGVMLYRMLTGHVPFRGRTRKETIDLIKNKEEYYSTVFPPAVAILCYKLLQKAPEKRFSYGNSTMLAFRADPAFNGVLWPHEFSEPFQPGELLCAEIMSQPALGSVSDDAFGNEMHLDLMAQSDIKFGRKKPLRFEEITTRDGHELFNERMLLKQASLHLSLDGSSADEEKHEENTSPKLASTSNSFADWNETEGKNVVLPGETESNKDSPDRRKKSIRMSYTRMASRQGPEGQNNSVENVACSPCEEGAR